NYENGAMQGLWQQWNDKGLKTDSMIYEKDYKIRYAVFTHYNKDSVLTSYSFTDSLKNTFIEKTFYNKGMVSSEVNFYGQKGLYKRYDSTGVITASDSVFTREESEAEFPGGPAGWATFLKR